MEHENLHITASGDGSVAAQRIGEVHVHTPGRRPAPWPHLVGAVPLRADDYRTRTETARLTAALAAGGAVLTGLPGSGKTQLAAEHARAGLQDGTLDAVVWITAGSAAAVADGYTQAGVELLGAEREDAAAEFRAWLVPRRQERPCRWLIVLDDVTDPNDLRGLLPPPHPHGRTLITTRLRDAALIASHRPGVEIGTFTPDEAADQLARALARHHRVEPAEQLRALAADLGHLPLALSQAAVYLVQEHLGAAAYRERLTARADLTPYYLPDDQSHTVAAALALAVERATGPARELLLLAALLDPNGIPDSVLTARPVQDHLGTDQAAHAVRLLHRLGLVRHIPTAPRQAVRVHQLVQHAARATLTPAELARYARVAADALTADWPGIETDAVHGQSLRACAGALLGNAEPALYQDGAHPLLLRHGVSLLQSGQRAAALAHFTRHAEAAQRLLGPDHRDTLYARYRQAVSRVEGGDFTGTAEFAAVLADQTRVLGPEHPDTLRTRRTGIEVRGGEEPGRLTEPLTELAEVLMAQVRLPGAESREGLVTLRALAELLITTAPLSHQLLLPVLDTVLSYYRERYGPEDPEIRAAGALVDRVRDDPAARAAADAALAELTEVLNGQERLLGPGDRATLRTRRSIAFVLYRSGRYEQGAAAAGALLDDETASLGPDHPDSFDTRGLLAACVEELDGPERAREVLADLLPRQQRVFGPGHARTLDTRREMARLTGATASPGHCGTAVAALAELFLDLLPMLGPDHEVTAETLDNLAVLHDEVQVLREGAAEAAAEGDPAWAAEELAVLRAAEGDPAVPRAALATALAALTGLLGPEHALVAEVRGHLEFWQAES